MVRWCAVQCSTLLVLGGLCAGIVQAQPSMQSDSPLWPAAQGRALAHASAMQSPSLVTRDVHATTRNIYKAALMSALVPGWGQFYSGHQYRGIFFATVEGGIWTAFTTFKVQENLRADRAIEYAIAVAGASTQGDDAYYQAVSQFLRNDGPGQWNEFVRRELRETGEVLGVEYSGDDNWAWPSLDQFERYRTLRRRKLEAGDNATDMIAIAILNRLVSVIDVVYAMRRDSQRESEPERLGLRLEVGRRPGEPLASLALRNRF